MSLIKNIIGFFKADYPEGTYFKVGDFEVRNDSIRKSEKGYSLVTQKIGYTIWKKKTRADYDNDAEVNFFTLSIGDYIRDGYRVLDEKELLSDTTLTEIHAYCELVGIELDTEEPLKDSKEIKYSDKMSELFLNEEEEYSVNLTLG